MIRVPLEVAIAEEEANVVAVAVAVVWVAALENDVLDTAVRRRLWVAAYPILYHLMSCWLM